MSQIDKLLYTGKTHTTGGRGDAARSSDGHLNIRLSPPGGSGRAATPSSCLPPAGLPASSAR
jgi:organic hydroperoxide reductase OsmC/OhrA